MMAKIMVTTFSDEEDVTDKVNEFLADRDLALSQVHIQFVTSVWYSEHRHNPKDKYLFEAYVTHPV
jgi:hypothetical protein